MAAAFIPAQLVCADATDPSLFPDGRFNLTVTSPPYNVGLQYGANVDDAGSYDDYLEFSRRWLANCFNWSADHGRLCMNIPLDKNSGGKQAVTADLTNIARQVGWRYHATIIWNEGNISRRTAWGSWMRPSAPHIIAPVETIVVLHKGDWKRQHLGDDNVTIERDEFMTWTSGTWLDATNPPQPASDASLEPATGSADGPAIAPAALLAWALKLVSERGATPITARELLDQLRDLPNIPDDGTTPLTDLSEAEAAEWLSQIWQFNGESAKRVGHPAPFPVELPRRCIRLLSYRGDKVFDPFAGSGSTLIAALQNDRDAWGVELDPNYVSIAYDRIAAETSQAPLL